MIDYKHCGGCCGIKGIAYLPDNPSSGEVRELKRLTKNLCYRDHSWVGRASFLVEVVINERQHRGWDQSLKEIGYKNVTVFRNTNSDNKVYVYHYYIPVEED